MLYNLLTRVTTEEGKEGGNKDLEDCSIEDFQKLLMSSSSFLEGMSEQQVVKLKVGSVGRVRRMYKNLVENQDLLLKIKMVNDGRIPRGLLLEGKVAIRNCLREFQLA